MGRSEVCQANAFEHQVRALVGQVRRTGQRVSVHAVQRVEGDEVGGASLDVPGKLGVRICGKVARCCASGSLGR